MSQLPTAPPSQDVQLPEIPKALAVVDWVLAKAEAIPWYVWVGAAFTAGRYAEKRLSKGLRL